MSIISKETFEKFTEEEKEKICKDYSEFVYLAENGIDEEERIVNSQLKRTMEDYFGKENLQPEKDSDMETQNTEWNKCTEQEQQNILEIYNNHPEWLDVVNALEDKFGSHNLQPKPKIKTWEDVEKVKDSYKSMVGYLLNFTNDVKLNKKLAATLKIAKLIELGYGGMVTEEEWLNHNTFKYCVEREDNELTYEQYRMNYNFIAFHTAIQRMEFMSYPENVKLVEQYHMI